MKNPKELQKQIRALLKEKKALMLAHNYQRDEVQATADICGDSLALSQAAAKSRGIGGHPVLRNTISVPLRQI